MNKALILGCSHASGCDLTHNADYTFELNHSYPALIASALGYEPINMAVPGGSNDAMFRIYEAHAHNLGPQDIVIACWTGANRTEFWSREAQQYLALCPGIERFKNREHKRIFQVWTQIADDHPFGLTARANKMKNILALNALAQINQHRVVNIDSFWPVDGLHWKAQSFWPLDDTFCVWASKRCFAETAHGHYELAAHQGFADFVLPSVKIFLNDSDTAVK